MFATRVPDRRGLALLADISDDQRRDGPSELLIRGKDAVVAMAVLSWRRHEVGKPVEKRKRREISHAARAGSRGFSRAPRSGSAVPQRKVNRGDTIRTCDLYVPNVAL